MLNRKPGVPSGPWDHEPDRLEWRDEGTGLPCLILRNHFGVLCGYAGVAQEHSWYGHDYSEHDDTVEVHGGLTYSGACQGEICHTPAPGEAEDVWWFGFDCGHYGDLTPSPHMFSEDGGTYRDVEYVREQVTALARQLAAVA